MSDDRASRLRERRRSSKSRAQESSPRTQESPADSVEDDDPTVESDEPDDSIQDDSAGESSTGDRSVKEEQVGTYMYLPGSQKRELKRVFNVIKAQYEYEFDEKFEKNRHFYPLLVQFGIESLDGADPSEVRNLLGDLRDD